MLLSILQSFFFFLAMSPNARVKCVTIGEAVRISSHFSHMQPTFESLQAIKAYKSKLCALSRSTKIDFLQSGFRRA